MKTEAEIEMTRPQAEGHPGPPGAGSGARDGLSLRASRREEPALHHHDIGLLALGPAGEWVSAVLSHPLWGHLSRQPQGLNTVPQGRTEGTREGAGRRVQGRGKRPGWRGTQLCSGP